MNAYNNKTDYCPWHFPEEAQALQKEWQRTLSEHQDVTFGEGCNISQKAAFFPDHFSCGDNCRIAAEAMVRGTVHMGAECSINSYTVVAGNIRMGDMVRIASNTSIFGFNHGHEDVEKPFCQQGCTSKGIVIEDNVWVGANVVIVDGVHVGANTILAAGAVVTKDIPPYSVAAGNPARVIRDRRDPKPSTKGLEGKLKTFGQMAKSNVVEVLNEAYDADQNAYVDNQQDRKLTDRAWCDAVEIAGAFGELPPHVGKEALIEKLQSFQNPETGCFDQFLENENPTPVEHVEANGYHYLCVGYALEVMGSHLKYKNSMLDRVTAEALNEKQTSRNWETGAWSAGAWNDHFGTAVYHDLKYHEGTYDLSAFFGWLNLKCNRTTGLWGEPTEKSRWLQPVNGFYRLTRGTYAQFGQPLPYPKEAIDTILMHCRQYDDFLDHHVTACNVLDVVHPLWLCAKQTDYRAPEIKAFMERQVDAIIDRWIPDRGFSFSAEHEPGLQGTEMWLSILYIAADYLGLADALGYSPKGVHRVEIAHQL